MAHTIFLGAFYTVAAIVAITMARALWRASRDLRRGRVEHIRWHADFEELPARDRACRHVLTGEFRSRQCPNGFDCRECETHNKLVARHPPEPATSSEEDMFGMAFPLDRFYHRGHTWAQLEPDGTMTVGLDDLGRRLIGTPESVDLPRPGTRIETNGPGFRVRRQGSELRLLAPVDGEVIETGGPEAGWYLRVRPDPLDVRHLLRGAEVRPWLLREMERLQFALGGTAATLADGGVPVEADLDAVSEMFLEP
jgi:hypothetical protein